VRREPDRAGIFAEIVQPQRLRVADQDAENPPAAWEISDRRMRLGVDAGRQEALQTRPRLVDHPQRRIPRSGQLHGGLDELLQERVQRERRAEGDAGIDERAEAVASR